MRCGEFPALAKHRITIQTRSDAADDYGGTAVTWSTLAQVWAVIEPMGGTEALNQEQMQSRVASRMTIRYLSSLKNTAVAGKYRVSYDSRTFPIKFVKNLDEDLKTEGNVFQQLYCEENYAEN